MLQAGLFSHSGLPLPFSKIQFWSFRHLQVAPSSIRPLGYSMVLVSARVLLVREAIDNNLDRISDFPFANGYFWWAARLLRMSTISHCALLTRR